MYEVKVLGATRSLFSEDNIKGNESESKKAFVVDCDEQLPNTLSAGIIAGIVCVVFAFILVICAFIIWR